MIEKTQNQTFTELLGFFKALADESRLKIVGLLTQQSCSVEQMAAILNLKPATVSHHLARLSEAGLVAARAEGYYNVYSLDLDALHRMAERLLSSDALPRAAEDLDLDAYDRKVLAAFSHPDGTIREFPAQQKKFLVIVRHVLQAFEFGRRYAEKDVNEIISRFHPDTASLRRAMVEYRFMARENGVYWRVEGNA